MTQLEEQLNRECKRVADLRKSEQGKYKVIGIDKFDGENWVHGHYTSAEKALSEARRLTKEAASLASDSTIATVFYAYAPNGNYLGGDTWAEE